MKPPTDLTVSSQFNRNYLFGKLINGAWHPVCCELPVRFNHLALLWTLIICYFETIY